MTELLHSIFVPLDGSSFAEQALAPAIALARATRTRIRLALVQQTLPPPVSPEAAKLYVNIEVRTRRMARSYLKRQVERVRRGGCPRVTSVVLSGNPGEALVDHAHEWSTSLIIMCTHGRGPVTRAWLGSVADHVVRHAGVPVLLLRPDANASPPELIAGGQILVPLDGSSFGEAALEPAAEIARRLGSQLRLLEVIRPVPMGMAEPALFTDGFDLHLAELRGQQAAAYLDRSVERMQTATLPVTSEIVVSPSIAGTILDVAHSEQVRLVALATHGRGGMNRLLLGGVADKVVRGALCPVLVCPSGKAAWTGRAGGRTGKRAVVAGA